LPKIGRKGIPMKLSILILCGFVMLSEGARAGVGLDCQGDLAVTSVARPKFNVPDEIQRTIERMRGSGNRDTLDRVKAFDELVKILESFRFPDFQKGILDSKLPQDILRKIERESKGLISVERLALDDDFKGAIALGPSGRTPRWQYEIVTQGRSLVPWGKAYREFGIDWTTDAEHTKHFLKAIENDDRGIVFLVPQNFLNFSAGEITKKEFQMILENQKLLSKTVFVFGAYDLFHDRKIISLFESTRLSDYDLNLLMMNVFAD